VRYNDPILETIARSIHAFFPRCRECGEPIELFEDAEVRILTQRVVHRRGCAAKKAGGLDDGASAPD
jgi:hypothetical protein